MDNIAKNLEKHLRVLTDEIGVRLAGSRQEYQAAEYLANEFRKFSPHVAIEEYPVMERAVSQEKLEVEINGKWIEFPCSLFGASCTTSGKTFEGEIVFFDSATSYQKSDLAFLKNKAVVHFGCHIENEESYKRLMEAAPAFILFVDTRYPGSIPLADGLFPAYVQKYGSVPSLNVAYMDAWNWQKNQASKAKICVVGEARPSKTSVVICEIPGTDPDAGVIYCGAHHDTQAGSVGADDNAIACAILLELAKIFTAKKHKCTFKLISFGAEEQLSLGSAAYVRNHRKEITENGIFMCNFDSMGSIAGWYDFTINGNDELLSLIREIYNRNDIYYLEKTTPCPYTDQFPFAACGVPGIWLFRPNCTAGLFYHHRVDNDAEIIDFRQSAVLMTATAKILEKIANSENTAQYRTIPADMQKEIDELFNNVYGGF
ncbi:MAG: M28 family peptidase [Lentisphaeria bacterium]|nr:M28 family peptidase [Lentisphaeria bacterium]